MTNIVVALAFATSVVVVMAPLFGYRLSLIPAPLEEELPVEDYVEEALTSPSGYGEPPAYEGFARRFASWAPASLDRSQLPLSSMGFL